MSTLSEREEALRRALFSAAQSIEPAADGFDRIQARLGTPRPALIAWIEGAWSRLLHRSPAVIEDFGRILSSVAALVWKRFGPTPGAHGRPSGPLSWLRPMAAMTVAIFVVAAGAYVGLSTSDFISNSGSFHQQGPGGPAHVSKSGGGTLQSKAASPYSTGTGPSATGDPSGSPSCNGSTTEPSIGPKPTTSSPTSGSSTGTTSPTSGGSSSPTGGSSSPTQSSSPTTGGSQGTQDPATSASQAPPTGDSAVTTAYQCGSPKKSSHHKTSAAATS
jgi:hypothetical protein